MLRFGAETPAAIRFGGATPAGIAIGATKVWPPATADRPGTLTHGVTSQRGGGVNIASVLSDPDGIRSIDAASILATDGRRQDISSAWVRRDANSFTHTDNRSGNRWRAATMSVTYTDTNGVQSTLTADWSV